MGPVRQNGYHPVRAGRQFLDHEFGLPAAQMNDTRYAGGNGVAGRGHGPVDEQVVVGRARSLLAGGRNLDPGSGEGEESGIRNQESGRRGIGGEPRFKPRKHKGTEVRRKKETLCLCASVANPPWSEAPPR